MIRSAQTHGSSETTMAMTAMRVGMPGAATTRMGLGHGAPLGRTGSDDTLRRTVAAAMAQESSLRLAESVRTYASQSRENGDSIHEVLEVLMELARETTPQHASSAKWSCDVADWAIAGYFEERESIRVAIWRARANR